jgi:hypothetical protein
MYELDPSTPFVTKELLERRASQRRLGIPPKLWRHQLRRSDAPRETTTL